MKTEAVCPLFGQSEEICDVGCGYISPDDARVIASYCSCRYGLCPKYQEVGDRAPVQAVQKAEVAPVFRGEPEVKPFRVKWPLPYQLRYVTGHFKEKYTSSKEENSMATSPVVKNKGLSVVLAGLGINLALGILYTWSIFKGAIEESIASGGAFASWGMASVQDPYAVACLVFSVAMILAGKLQDKFGPRITCMLGGLLVGGGFILISQTTNYWAWIVGFGVLAGMGIGFGYSAATPPAIKWFSPAKTGIIAGIVVSGFGLASVYIAPLAKYLMATYGLQQSMLFFGIAFAVVVGFLSLFIINPPEGYVPEGAKPGPGAKAVSKVVDLAPSQLFTQGKFYVLWTCFFIGAGAGLMVIGNAKGLAKASLGEMAFIAVIIMSVGNAAGRLIAGAISDKIGRANTLLIMLVFQAALMFASIPVLGGTEAGHPIVVVLLVTFMVFNYGTNLSLFPSFAKDNWGLKHFGMNYGLLFSAWGVGGFVLSRVSAMLPNVATSFAVAGVLLLVGAMMSLSLRKPAAVAVEQEATAAETFEEEDLAVQKAD